MTTESVPGSADVSRVLALPRRVWTLEAGEALATWLTNELTTAAGKAAGARLKVPQAILLWELYQCRGAYGALPPGIGKTLITWLAAFMLSSRRPHLFTLANLRDDKTPRDFASYRQHWATPCPPPKINGYSILNGKENLHVLEDLAPDFLGLDECDKLRNAGNAAAKRLGGYRDLNRDAVYMALTGTPQRHSIADDTHVVTWCLKERAPVALSSDALKDWCSGLDPEAFMGKRLRPGVLMSFADQTEVDTDAPELERAREGYARRFEQTPGVLVWPYDSCDQPITIRFHVAPDDPIIERAIIDFRKTSATPDGWPVNDAIVKWGKEREFANGFYYIYDPHPPQDWLIAKYQDGCFCRDMIQATASYARARAARGPKPLDTEDAVRSAFPDEPCIQEWRRIKGSFKPQNAPVWLSGSVIHWAASWALQRTGAQAGIVWCEHDAVAHAVAQATGLPLFGEKGLRIDANGQTTRESIEEFTEKAAARGQLPSIICQEGSNERGRNLQMYADNLILGWHPSAEKAEQLLARTHRQGQKRPVNFDVLVLCGLTMVSFYNSLSEARQVKRMKRLTQKILAADIVYGEAERLPKGARWVVASNEDSE